MAPLPPAVKPTLLPGTPPTPLLVTDFSTMPIASKVGPAAIGVGNYSATGGQLTMMFGGSLVWQLNQADYHIRFQVPRTATNGGGGAGWKFLFRYQDQNNYWFIQESTLSGLYAYGNMIAGIFSYLGFLSGGGTVVNGNTISIDCVGQQITVGILGVGDTAFHTTSIPGNLALATGTGVGVLVDLANTDAPSFSNLTVWAPLVHPVAWHTSPQGRPNGAGTLGLPLDIDTMAGLADPMVDGSQFVGQDKDRVYVHMPTDSAGYGSIRDSVLNWTIGAGANGIVYVENYPGEQRPKIFRQMQFLLTSPGGLSFSHILGPGDDATRRTNYNMAHGPIPGSGTVTLGIDLHTVNTRFNYCSLTNRAGAWFFGEQALGSVIFMSLTAFNGFRDITNTLPAIQGLYWQSDGGANQQFTDLDTCFVCHNYQQSIQIYGSGASQLRYASVRNCLLFSGGDLGTSYAGGQACNEILVGSTSDFVHVDQVYLDGNWVWGNAGGFALGYNGHDNTFISYTNNHVYAAFEVYTLHYFRTLYGVGNKFYQPPSAALAGRALWLLSSSALIGTLPTGTVDYNTYYNSQPTQALIWNDGSSNHIGTDIPTWYSITGFDQHSTLVPFSAALTEYAVKANTYEPTALAPTPRAFIYVFNFQQLNFIQIDLSSVLALGNGYEIFDWNQFELAAPLPVVAGVYRGDLVQLPIKPQPIPRIFADQGAQGYHDVPPTPSAGMPGAYYMVVTKLQAGG